MNKAETEREKTFCILGIVIALVKRSPASPDCDQFHWTSANKGRQTDTAKGGILLRKYNIIRSFYLVKMP